MSPTTPDLVTSVSAPTYAAGSVERGGWSVLMAERGACGFGLLQQDTRLDAASLAHANYLVSQSAVNGGPASGHGEQAGTAGYTGGNALTRAVAQGFPTAPIDEIITAEYTVRPTAQGAAFAFDEAQGAASMRQLLGTVYHLSGSMYGGRVGGIAAAHGTFATTGGNSEEDYRFGALIATLDANPQRLGTGTVATYPCAGATQLTSTFKPATESPNPFPDITNTSTVYGTPVYLKVDAGSVLTVTSATITRGDGTVVATRQITKAVDPSGELGANEFFAIPASALLVGATYSVQVAGTVDGTPFNKAFTFSPAY